MFPIPGPNGSGKSTLLRALAGLTTPSRGTVSLRGRALESWPRRERARRLAWLAQDAGVTNLTAAEVVGLGRFAHSGWLAHRKSEDDAAIRRAMLATGSLPWATRRMTTLSGGERQRVLLARVLAVEAAVVLKLGGGILSDAMSEQRRGRAVMVCGATSGAGKSFLVTALARWYARRGLRVAPFKAQNMSNNARVVADGEMGSAQYFQALAARCVPDVRMNPVLLKPESDTHSQVILLGERRDDLARVPWRERAALLWPTIRASLDALRASHDLVVIEGAGSPAEINLATTDIVNMRVAAAADAATLIVCDIDRGGAFAHLYGTYQLLAPEHRALIRGFVLNKFRGDAALLAPGPEMLQSLTGVPTVAVLPLWREHGLPEEDGVFDARRGGTGLAIAIVAYPRISNLDEFSPLQRVPGLSLSWARQAQTIASADLLILPGSKQVAEDLAWLRQTGLDAAITAHARAGKPILAICGGLQMLGEELRDPHGVEGAARGLGVLPLTTEFQATKRYRHAGYTFGTLSGYWSALSGISFDAYEIRHGHTTPSATTAVAGTAGALAARTELQTALGDGCGWQYREILAVYAHGMLESPAVMRALFGRETPTLEDSLNGLADFVDRHFDADLLMSWAEGNPERARVASLGLQRG